MVRMCLIKLHIIGTCVILNLLCKKINLYNILLPAKKSS